MTTGLTLTGGGARGAYQAGALVELLPALDAAGRRPSILSGASVGALNATALAAAAHLPVDEQVAALTSVWAQVRERDVLEPFVRRAPQVLLRYASELSPFPGPRLRGLVGTAPLRATIARWVDWDQVEANVGDDGPLDTLLVMATAVATGRATAFVAGAVPDEGERRVRYVPTRLGADHLVASASIPLLFEATHVEDPPEAAGWYSDGSTRLSRPVSPVIDAGADDVVVVSTTGLGEVPDHTGAREAEPDLADVGVNVLEALVRDVLIDDLDRCHRQHDVDCLVVAPEDPLALGDLARQVMDDRHRHPTGALRSDLPLIDWALGSESPRQGELLSYLLFDPDFVAGAMELGAADARRALEGL
ncbi:patatin-like phospholipase family protein [Iamia majanohamensis]|uniref:Patatin-like phospholipase family protein n=1 Tax=Iamia majanohamensis TaxID=467976 RepID=A0AAF0BX80_9ACTN|nr:patatin-like phospholipase family protein [Iamia majanohamensis]WCO68394.1 patatin-like phospholipase family protein [Iamia majanohamensis]